RIMKLVAEVSSSISSAEAPASTASTRDAACEVEPEVSGPERDEGREGCEGMGRSVREGGWGCQAGSWELSGASSSRICAASRAVVTSPSGWRTEETS